MRMKATTLLQQIASEQGLDVEIVGKALARLVGDQLAQNLVALETDFGRRVARAQGLIVASRERLNSVTLRATTVTCRRRFPSSTCVRGTKHHSSGRIRLASANVRPIEASQPAAGGRGAQPT